MTTSNQTESPNLLSSFDLCGLPLRNRVVMAPLTRARAGRQRVPNDVMAEYYVQRASAGLIIAEATSISEQGLGWVDSPGIYDEGQVAGWKKVVAALHAANGYLTDQFLQSKTNQRTDIYGGTVEKRFRLLREIVEAILTVWPANRVGVRLSPNGNFKDAKHWLMEEKPEEISRHLITFLDKQQESAKSTTGEVPS